MRWLLAVLLVACGKDKAHTFDPVAGRGVFEAVNIDAPPGLSGLAIDDGGGLWAIPERDHQMISIAMPPASASPMPVPATQRYPLDGIPDGVDTEGLAWLGGPAIALALEGQDDARAGVAFAERRGDRFVVTKLRWFESSELGVKLTKNHGTEGACGHAGDLLLAIEATGKLDDGTRFAPIVRITGETTTVWKLRLATDTGKISTLDCSIAESGDATVLAIERHYGVSRIVKFVVPSGPATKPLTETLVIDLAPILHDSLNLEGLVKLADGRLVAIHDNQGKRAAGPDVLLVFPATVLPR